MRTYLTGGAKPDETQAMRAGSRAHAAAERRLSAPGARIRQLLAGLALAALLAAILFLAVWG